MKIKYKSNIFFIIFLLIATEISQAKVTDKIVFSGGAKLNNYQPSIIIPILSEAFKRNGIKFKAEYIPSARSLIMSNSGQKDGELHRIYNFHEVSNGKYPNLIRIESQLLSIWLAAFTLRKDIKIEAWSDLKNYTVIYRRGRQNVRKLLEKNLQFEQIYAVNTDEQAFKILAKKRVDIVISESRKGRAIIDLIPELSGITEVKKLEETRIYSYINKKHELLAPIIATTIEKMKVDGTFSKIVNEQQK